MKNHTTKLLKKKGWVEEDIKKAEEIIAARRLKDKSKTLGHASNILYWSVFVLIVIGNFIISMALIPFLLVLSRGYVDVIIIIIGFSFGLLFNLILKDIEHVSKTHHVVTALIIPVIALMNFYVMTTVANAINNVLKLTVIRDALKQLR